MPMAVRILDTNILILFWRQKRAKSRKSTLTENVARRWAKELIDLRRSNAIVSPVAIEFLGGSTNREELKLYRAFIGEFVIVDRGNVPADDWKEARQRAERVPANSRPRQLGDCLIVAIAKRLRLDVDSLDANV
jgi:predicted nucleic acid-binding protein